ncbi:hypothetical protein [Streptosporangium lutulentum]|uniref:Uncharacterized protein n=1 Tax=Streptosporangium lutulentum TaxID=1461250 RepID=A0ABT9QN02_9ACTN|nr:hypothetical protein [Streptosporangium lutulentum]MDP9848116.1 hypothetical protein [Streptosporangium lutulentum]
MIDTFIALSPGSEFNPNVPAVERTYAVLAGSNKDGFEADRVAASKLKGAIPGVTEVVQENAAAIARAVASPYTFVKCSMQPRYDPGAVEVAKLIQARAPRWVVLWRPYRRVLQAWECSDPRLCRTVMGRSATELWQRMQEAELDLWRASPRAMTADRPPTTPVPGGREDLPEAAPRRSPDPAAPRRPGRSRGPKPHQAGAHRVHVQ